jgi:hypothetical protein
MSYQKWAIQFSFDRQGELEIPSRTCTEVRALKPNKVGFSINMDININFRVGNASISTKRAEN